MTTPNGTKMKFENFIGNKQAIEKLRLLIDEAIDDSVARLPDFAFIGPAGHGKNTLATVVANETGRKLLTINSTVIRKPIQFHALIVDLFTSQHSGCIVHLDEAHMLSRQMQNNLLSATEQPRELHTTIKDQTFKNPIPNNCSFIFSTTHSAKLIPPLMSRLEEIELLPYSLPEHLEMAVQYLEREHKITRADLEAKALVEIAKRARSGRQVAKFCDIIVRYLKKHEVKLTLESVEKCFRVLDVDKNGLTRLDRLMLEQLQSMKGCVGLDTLDAILPASKNQIKDQIEPFLLQRGFMIRTSGGRTITPKGRQAIASN